MRTIVIIGAGGFIGSYLTQFFSINNNVIPIFKGGLNLLDNREVHDFLKGTTPDVVINAYSAGGKDRVNEQSLDIMSTNLIVFDNFIKNKHLFKKYINIGSGAEFTGSGMHHEDDILTCVPTTAYGLSKNIISRMCLQEPNFYTLRLFGCFGKGEPSFRLFTKYLSGQDEFKIDDKYFDNISIKDFFLVMRFFVTSDPIHKDVNCVFPKKLLISEQIKLLSEVTGHVRPITYDVGSSDYIGSSARIQSLGLLTNDITNGMKAYL